MKILITRRQLITRSALLPLFAVPLLNGCTEKSSVCVDTELLGVGEKQMRRTLEYVESTADATQQCDNCQFFRASGAGNCGECEILGGAVSRQGYCSSWAQTGENPA
jgi:hypothetical protein